MIFCMFNSFHVLCFKLFCYCNTLLIIACYLHDIGLQEMTDDPLLPSSGSSGMSTEITSDANTLIDMQSSAEDAMQSNESRDKGMVCELSTYISCMEYVPKVHSCNIVLIETEDILEDEDLIFYEAIEQHSITGTVHQLHVASYISFSYAYIGKTFKTHYMKNILQNMNNFNAYCDTYRSG